MFFSRSEEYKGHAPPPPKNTPIFHFLHEHSLTPWLPFSTIGHSRMSPFVRGIYPFSNVQLFEFPPPPPLKKWRSESTPGSNVVERPKDELNSITKNFGVGRKIGHVCLPLYSVMIILKIPFAKEEKKSHMSSTPKKISCHCKNARFNDFLIFELKRRRKKREKSS